MTIDPLSPAAKFLIGTCLLLWTLLTVCAFQTDEDEVFIPFWIVFVGGIILIVALVLTGLVELIHKSL